MSHHANVVYVSNEGRRKTTTVPITSFEDLTNYQGRAGRLRQPGAADWMVLCACVV